MSPMRLLILIILFIKYCSSKNEVLEHIQPQLVYINDQDGIYVTNENHYIGQVLFRYDKIELACECQTQLNYTKYLIYWTINNKIYHQFNNSNSIRLIINMNTVQSPITYVKCHCIFLELNLTKSKMDYHYLLYIDFESEPSLKTIHYSVQSSIIKQHFNNFIHHHFIVMLILLFIIIGITCPLIILSFIPPF